MAIVRLPDERRFELEKNERFQKNVRIAIFNLAQYWKDHDGSPFAGAALLRWAKMRFWSHNRIIANPGNIDFDTYLKQFISVLKNHDVYDEAMNPYSEDTVIAYMIAQNKFAAIIEQVFDLRILDIEL